MKRKTRRNFFRNSLISLVGIFLSPLKRDSAREEKGFQEPKEADFYKRHKLAG